MLASRPSLGVRGRGDGLPGMSSDKVHQVPRIETRTRLTEECRGPAKYPVSVSFHLYADTARMPLKAYKLGRPQTAPCLASDGAFHAVGLVWAAAVAGRPLSPAHIAQLQLS